MDNNTAVARASAALDLTSSSVLEKSTLDSLPPTAFEDLDPSIYADWYLHSCYPEIPFHDEKQILEFLVSEAPKSRGAECLLELGCGPVVSHALPFVPYVRSMILSDYLDSNLELIRKWLVSDPSAHSWSLHTAFVMQKEGVRLTAETLRIREERLRNKVRSLVVGDLLSKKPIRRSRQFPVVSCFYATEQAASDELEWMEVMQNLGGLVEPGGLLYLACVRDSRFYAIHDKEKNAVRIPIVPITQTLLEKGLRAAGFSHKRSVINSADINGLEEEGLSGVILARAVKSD